MLDWLLVGGATVPCLRFDACRKLEDSDPFNSRAFEYLALTEVCEPLDRVTGQENGRLLPVEIEFFWVTSTQPREYNVGGNL